jgi:hypothetical protein
MMPPKMRRRVFALFDEGAFAIDCYYLGSLLAPIGGAMRPEKLLRNYRGL